jgi:hypothetical protein
MRARSERGGFSAKYAREKASNNIARAYGKVLRWDGAEEGATAVDIERLRPGDVVVLASARGGYDEFGWNPASTDPVPDLGDDAYHARTGRTIERIDDVEADVEGDRVRRWCDGAVIETLPSGESGRSRTDMGCSSG